jgi:hypothetical protein
MRVNYWDMCPTVMLHREVVDENVCKPFVIVKRLMNTSSSFYFGDLKNLWHDGWRVSPLSQELDQEELWPSPAYTFVTTWKRVLSVTSFGVLRPPIASPAPPI